MVAPQPVIRPEELVWAARRAPPAPSSDDRGDRQSPDVEHSRFLSLPRYRAPATRREHRFAGLAGLRRRAASCQQVRQQLLRAAEVLLVVCGMARSHRRRTVAARTSPGLSASALGVASSAGASRRLRLALCPWLHADPSSNGKRFAQKLVRRGSASTRRTTADIFGAASQNRFRHGPNRETTVT